jgi:selenocysteine-specific elongation factor
MPARLFPLEGKTLLAGSTGWVQVRLSRPTAVWRRQRFIIRVPSAASTIAGGMIADLDPVRRAHEHDTARLEALASADLEAAIEGALSGRRLELERLAALLTVSRGRLETALTAMAAAGRTRHLGRLYLDAAGADRFAAALIDALRGYHDRFPAHGFMPRGEARQLVRLPLASFDDLVNGLAATGRMCIAPHAAGRRTESSADGLALPEHRARLASIDAEVHPAETRFLDLLSGSPMQPPPLGELLAECGLGREALRRLVETGRVVRVDDTVYLTSDAYARLVHQVEDLLKTEGAFTIARLRDHLRTSRKYALAFAALLDDNHITQRRGDERIAVRTVSADRH